MLINKPSPDELRLEDFFSYPIWGFVHDDGDEVTPVDYPGYLKWSSGGNALFVLCEYTFHDATRMKGVIFVRMTNHTVYMLTFPLPDGTLYYFPVNSPLEGDVTPENLSTQIGKAVEEIFPIQFDTEFYFENGEKLTGSYLPEQKN